MRNPENKIRLPIAVPEDRALQRARLAAIEQLICLFRSIQSEFTIKELKAYLRHLQDERRLAVNHEILNWRGFNKEQGSIGEQIDNFLREIKSVILHYEQYDGHTNGEHFIKIDDEYWRHCRELADDLQKLYRRFQALEGNMLQYE